MLLPYPAQNLLTAPLDLGLGAVAGIADGISSLFTGNDGDHTHPTRASEHGVGGQGSMRRWSEKGSASGRISSSGVAPQAAHGGWMPDRPAGQRPTADIDML